MLRSIEIGKRARDHVSLLELFRSGQGLKQPAPHNLKSLFGSCRSPRRFNSPNYIASGPSDPSQRARAHGTCRAERGALFRLCGLLMRGGSADGLGLFHWRTFNFHRLVRAALFRDWLDPHGTSDFGRFIDGVNYPDICQSFIA
jgi:hypothetical protein